MQNLYYRNEVWKEYPLNVEHENTHTVEISNYGRIKAYNCKNPNGKILSGTLQNGYPCVRFKLFKKRSDKVVESINKYHAKISYIQNEIKELKKNISENAQLINELLIKKKKLVNNRKRYIKKTNLKRTHNVLILIHRAVAELFLKKQNENQKFVIHLDFIKDNNKMLNLSWATEEEVYDRFKKHPKNINNNQNVIRNSKLTEINVLHIKKRLKKGETLKSLSKRFGVSDMQIHRIKTGENWSHVKLLEDIIVK